MAVRADNLLCAFMLCLLTASGGLRAAWSLDSLELQRELREAIESGDEERAVLAIDRGAEPIRNLFDQAVDNGWISLVEALLDRGQWKGGKEALDPLIKAVHLGDKPMVWVLLERGAPLNKIWRGESVLETAIRMGQTQIALLLIDSGSDFHRRAHHALRLAARHGEAAVVLRLIERGSDLNDMPNNLEATRSNMTPLMEAAAAGHLEIVRRLLQKGADRGITNVRRDTAYSLAKLSASDKPDNDELKQIVKLLKP